jgi:hypothetical protein
MVTVMIRTRVQMFTTTVMSPLDVVSAHLASGGSGVEANFSVDANGGITRSGDAEASDAEPEESGEVLGRGQRRRVAARRYQGPAWEEH